VLEPLRANQPMSRERRESILVRLRRSSNNCRKKAGLRRGRRCGVRVSASDRSDGRLLPQQSILLPLDVEGATRPACSAPPLRPGQRGSGAAWPQSPGFPHPEVLVAAVARCLLTTRNSQFARLRPTVGSRLSEPTEHIISRANKLVAGMPSARRRVSQRGGVLPSGITRGQNCRVVPTWSRLVERRSRTRLAGEFSVST
jgi:hypothetical protein